MRPSPPCSPGLRDRHEGRKRTGGPQTRLTEEHSVVEGLAGASAAAWTAVAGAARSPVSPISSL